ncbi:hypothetical protein NW805_10425 [Synechococcus sp. W60.1]|uniref:hypothetical protein n=1 Tax=Synechococcus sp. W60.1 TaxID=2964516 RepID=UPI0039C35781
MNRALRGKGSLVLSAALVGVGVLVQGLRAQTLEKPTLKALEDSVEGNVVPVLHSEPALPPQAVPTSARTGPFRVGNRTPHPVRLVILMRSGERMINPETAHWDFAPGEGGSEGLLLSLGEEPLQIGPGDIVVAFALDGTRRLLGAQCGGRVSGPVLGWGERLLVDDLAALGCSARSLDICSGHLKLLWGNFSIPHSSGPKGEDPSNRTF